MLGLLSGFKTYLYAGVAAIVFGLSVVCYIQHIELNGKADKISSLNTELTVSNSSVTATVDELNKVTATLEANELKDKQTQAFIETNLQHVDTQDKPLEDLEQKLKDRKPTGTCPIPKDLDDAWNTL